MKYSETVRDLAAKNAHWRYDENFHFLRQKTLFSWDQIHWELWLQAHHMTKTAPAFSSESHNKNSRKPFPSGFCWKFHRGRSVPAARLSTNVSNVGINIPQINVHFPADRNQIRTNMCPDKRDYLHLPNPPLYPALSRPLSTPIKIDQFQFYLEGYPARSNQYLLNGFRFGFSIDYVGSRRNFSSKNLLSAITNPKAIDDKLDKEVVLGCPE